MIFDNIYDFPALVSEINSYQRMYDNWLSELRRIMVEKYHLSSEVIETYSTPENWKDYYDEDFTPSEALEEDSGYWYEA
jgi:hypothetical protein